MGLVQEGMDHRIGLEVEDALPWNRKGFTAREQTRVETR